MLRSKKEIRSKLLYLKKKEMYKFKLNNLETGIIWCITIGFVIYLILH